LLLDIQLARQTVAAGHPFSTQDGISKLEKRYQDLKELLPSYGTIGYTADFPIAILDIDDVVAYDRVKAEYRTLQYILAPVVLKPVTPETGRDLHFVIKNSRLSVANQLVFHDRAFVLLKDFGDGISVYGRRTD
jgi:hypothetical protein